MKPSTREWIKKAELDYQLAVSLARRKKFRFMIRRASFVSSAEKYLKARIEEAGLRIQRTHDLDRLLQALLSVEPLWGALLPTVLRLNPFAVEFRYPGHEAKARDAKAARDDAKAIRREVRLSPGLKV